METSPLQTENDAERHGHEAHQKRAETLGSLLIDNPANRLETIASRTGLSANQLHGKRPPPEKIGHVIVGAERAASDTKDKENLGRQPHLANIDTMNRFDLLLLSQEITVGNTSLRQIFETHLIGENGLRRLIAEHLRGGDVKRALRQEVLEREIDFERDPVLRDRAGAGPTSLAPVSATLDSLIEKVNGVLGQSPMPKPSINKLASLPPSSRDVPNRRRLLDVIIIFVIVILLTLVIILATSKH